MIPSDDSNSQVHSKIKQLNSDRTSRLLITNQSAPTMMRCQSESSYTELLPGLTIPKFQVFTNIRAKLFKQGNLQSANIRTRTICLEETKRKTIKTYHPIIRLLSSIKSSLHILAILSFVPIKPVYLHIIEANNHPLGNLQFGGADMLNIANNNVAFFNNQNQDWAKRMLKANNDLQQQHFHNLPKSNLNSNPVNLVAELRDGQSHYRPNMRQTLLADFVANQGQRILKNLVNNTISDIVSQSAIRLATKSLIPQSQQYLLQQLQQQQQLANYQMSPNENNRSFPSMGRLYTLLFPNNQLVSQQTQVKTQPSSIINLATNNNPTPVEAIQSSSSNNQNMYLGNQKESLVSQQDREQPHKETYHERQVVNLTAPYDSRPRKSIKSSSSSPGSPEPNLFQGFAQFENSKRPERDISRPLELRRLNQRPNLLQFDQGQESAGDEVTSGENGALQAGLDTESMSPYETSDLLLSNQRTQEEQELDERNKPEVNPTKSDHFESPSEQPELQPIGEQSNEVQQLTSSSDFSGYFGARKNHAENERDQSNGRNLAIEAQIEQLNQARLQNQESNDNQSNHKIQSDGGEYLVNNENQSLNQSIQDEDPNLSQVEVQPIDQQQQQQQQHLLESTTNDKRDEKVGQLETLYGLNNGPESFKTSLMNDTQNDESFLTAKLPSQYDAVIRMPPEGYYDDYFKPVSSNIALQSSKQTPESLINQEDGISEYPTINQIPIEAGRDHSERFEIEPEGITTSAQSINSSQISQNQQNHNYHDSNQTSFAPLSSMDYTKQFYSNKQQIKPSEMNVEHGIEVFPQTNQTSSNKKDEILNYEIPQSTYENLQNDSHTSNHPDISSKIKNSNTKYNQSLDDIKNESRNSSTNHYYPDHNEDTIQVIIANTNNSRDPVSNEKVINYTSDGQNITRVAGKPARNTFVNKDMNEFPPADEQNFPRENLMPERNNMMQQQVSGLNNQQQMDYNEEHNSFKQQIQPPNFSLEQSNSQSQSQSPVKAHIKLQKQTQTQTQHQQQSQQNGNESDEEHTESRPNNENDNEIRRVTSKASFGNYNNNASQNTDESSDAVTISPKIDNRDSISPREFRLDRNSNHRNPVSRDRRQKNEQDNYNRNKKRSREHNIQKYSVNNPRMSKHGHQNHYRTNRLHKQQTIRRPQVTQAHFDPKDLITNAPTPSPSATESTIGSITELPAKMKRLKDNQPDKNELMNELLTALDRVKVAIYKLQPLTAKMNAIYRKSVTSNTRDIIMDNHKGTYAKRYPPGDYDDTYDRMHPSELLSRQRSSESRSGRARRTNNGVEADESTSNAVYLPAPREILESYERNYSISNNQQTLPSPPTTPPQSVSKSIIEIQNLGESQIVATGIGRRLGDGRVRGELNVSSLAGSDFNDYNQDERLISRENLTQKTNFINSSLLDSVAPTFIPVKQLLEKSQSPLFGYRITIFQSPDDAETEEDKDEIKNRERFSYVTDGSSFSERFGEEDDSNTDDGVNYEFENDLNSFDVDSKTTTMKPSIPNEDSMVTSESSVVETEQNLSTLPSSSTVETAIADKQELEEGESSKKEEKKKKHESEKEKSSHKEQGKKKKEASKKSSSKKKKHEEEKKKKKEYKKIKHNKKVVSKEKKSMKRDKHIKAHDRGAAKEKALKERTQIEFFEREQIVDDEFEKGKKSTVKAGWETGHDSKKTMKDSSSGDPMSVGGSHHVAQHVKDKHMEKGSKVALAASSAKKSNKFEKKDMDAKGKKFKGWREKGYKIITETEFIDRGSLHDSAYKKRDKGAAHHQKYKKHQASSEGHHGSMHVHQKKSAKEEKKKSKMHEKKASNSKKSEKEGIKHEKGSDKKKKEKSEDKHSSASSDNPVEVMKSNSGEEEDALEGKESIGNIKKQAAFAQPVLLSAGSNSFQTPSYLSPANSNSAFTKLLNANHHEEPVGLMNRQDDLSISNNNSNLINTSQSRSGLNQPPNRPSESVGSSTKYKLVGEFSDDESNRRSDNVPISQQPIFMQHHNVSLSQDKSNATILDIVDNLTGKQINKAKIGTYELEGHNNFHHNRSLGNSFGSNTTTNNSLLNYPKQMNVAKHHPTLSPQATFQSRNYSDINDSNNNTLYMTTKQRPQIKPQSMRQQFEDENESGLLQVLQKVQRQRQISQESQDKSFTQTLAQQPDRLILKSSNYPTTPSYLTTEQARLATNLLNLVQQANELHKAGPIAASDQHSSFIDANYLAQDKNQFPLQKPNFISPPSISGAYQAPPAAILNPTNINYADSGGFRTLGSDHFLDYEQYPLSRSQQTFFIG